MDALFIYYSMCMCPPPYGNEQLIKGNLRGAALKDEIAATTFCPRPWPSAIAQGHGLRPWPKAMAISSSGGFIQGETPFKKLTFFVDMLILANFSVFECIWCSRLLIGEKVHTFC